MKKEADVKEKNVKNSLFLQMKKGRLSALPFKK